MYTYFFRYHEDYKVICLEATKFVQYHWSLKNDQYLEYQSIERYIFKSLFGS